MKNNTVIQFLIVRTLHRMTAKAMGAPFRPGIPPLPAYACFTQEQMEQIANADIEAVQKRMYQSARRMGGLIRNVLFIRSNARARRVIISLYRNIGIDLEGSCPGTVTIRRCYFSEFYTPEMCAIMSAMDQGIFAGLFGGGDLTFVSRITEGCSCCRAVFAPEETRFEK